MTRRLNYTLHLRRALACSCLWLVANCGRWLAGHYTPGLLAISYQTLRSVRQNNFPQLHQCKVCGLCSSFAHVLVSVELNKVQVLRKSICAVRYARSRLATPSWGVRQYLLGRLVRSLNLRVFVDCLALCIVVSIQKSFGLRLFAFLPLNKLTSLDNNTLTSTVGNPQRLDQKHGSPNYPRACKRKLVRRCLTLAT